MDIVIDYGLDQFIVELKIWNGGAAHDAAYEQLLGYMDAKGAAEGYTLLIYGLGIIPNVFIKMFKFITAVLFSYTVLASTYTVF